MSDTNTPLFGCQLPNRYCKEAVREWPVIVEEKHAGARAQLIMEKQRTRIVSITGETIQGAQWLAHEVHRKLDHLHTVNGRWWILDGNLINDANGLATIGGDVSTPATLRFKTFDLMHGSGSLTGFDQLPAMNRRALLYLLIKALGHPRIEITPSWLAYNHEEVMTYYHLIRKGGGEGVIVKDMDATYQGNHSNAWLTVSDTHTAHVPIVGFKRGTGRFSRTLGALQVEYNGKICHVGAGFTKAQRESIYNQCIADFDTLLKGRLIEVDYQQESPDGFLRSCLFVRFTDTDQ